MTELTKDEVELVSEALAYLLADFADADDMEALYYKLKD